jgi:sialate O-acetylesterase
MLAEDFALSAAGVRQHSQPMNNRTRQDLGRWSVAIVGLLLAGAAHAELRLPAIFSDGMVLQRDAEVAVWGWADPGEPVTVSFAGQEQRTAADDAGKFKVRLSDLDASVTPRTLTVTAANGETTQIRNVLVGEVWLCSGQSNMQWPVSRAQDFETEQANADYPQIRMFLTDLTANIIVQEDCTGSWKVCMPGTVGQFSATAYFFGRELHRKLKVPVGLIRSCWGGTRIEAWCPMESLEPFALVMENKAQQDAKAAAFDEKAEAARHARAIEKWKEKADQARAAGKKPPNRPRKQVHPHAWQNYPANLYNAMIHPLVPFTLRGAIWYQGEGNTHSLEEAVLYRDLLGELTSSWRQDWEAGFPFYAVQLPNFREPQSNPVQDSAWPFIRESFMKFHREVPNAGMAITIDVGEANDIHPANKQAVGYRLAQQALARTYGFDCVAGGPVYNGMKRRSKKIILSFDDVGSGLVSQDGQPLRTFAIAGADRQFVHANAAIKGNTVVVSADEVKAPEAVRYAWSNNPEGCNLFNKEGFPASPFRTDDWPPAAKP